MQTKPTNRGNWLYARHWQTASQMAGSKVADPENRVKKGKQKEEEK